MNYKVNNPVITMHEEIEFYLQFPYAPFQLFSFPTKLNTTIYFLEVQVGFRRVGIST